MGLLATDFPIAPSGDCCLVIELAQHFSLAANQAAAALATRLRHAATRGELPGVSDVVPAMVTVGLHYDPARIRCAQGELPYQALRRQVQRLMLAPAAAVEAAPSRTLNLPVCYGGEYGPDLAQVASACGLSTDEVIACHTQAPVSVLMLGFAPGHAYLGPFDARLNLPRRSVPRTAVAQGSVGLANGQSVLYPTVLPGGWNLIGRTPLPLFTLADASPCLLNAGDQVQFVAITETEFAALAREHA